MKPVKHACAALIGLCMLSFSFPGDNMEQGSSYYSLKFLEEAASPRQVALVKFTEDRRGTSLVHGTLVTYKNRNAASVRIAGDFNSWDPVSMEKGKHGVWYYLIESSSRDEKIRYKFCVDGIWVADPNNIHKDDDNAGSYVSLVRSNMQPEGIHLTFRVINRRKNTIEFRLYAPKASIVSLVGDFNNWNPENDLLRKGDDGVWRLQKRIPDGTYRYNYIIDGNWRIDRYNPQTATNEVGQMCSVLKMK